MASVSDASGPPRRRTARAVAGAVTAWLLVAVRLHATAWSEPATADAAPRGSAFLARLAAEGEGKALDAVQAADEDPWVLAEELILLGKTDVARRVAGARLGDNEAALLTYIGTSPAPSAATAGSVVRANALLDAGKPAEALALLDEPASAANSLTDIRVLDARAKALHAMGRAAEAKEALWRLSARAFGIGWRRGEMTAQRTLLDRLGPEEPPAVRATLLARLLEIDNDARDLGRSAEWAATLGLLEKDRRPRLAQVWLMEAERLFDATAKRSPLSAERDESRVRALVALAQVHLQLGSSAPGFDVALRARDAAAQHPGLRRKAATVLAMAYQAFGRLEDADAAIREVIPNPETETGEEGTRLLGSLARIRLERGNLEDAKRLYAQVLASDLAKKDAHVGFIYRLHQATVAVDAPPELRTSEGLQAAVVQFKDLLRDLQKQPRDVEWREEIEANAKAVAARALNLLHRGTDALGLLREAAATTYAREWPGFARYVAAEYAHALRVAGQPLEALGHADRALQALEAELGAIRSTLALGLLQQPDAARLIEEYVAAALQAGSPAYVLAALERTRGITFLNEARQRRASDAHFRAGVSFSEVTRLAELIGLAAEVLAKAKSEGSRDAVAEARLELWARRRQLRTARDREELDSLARTPPPPPEAADTRPPPPLRSDEAMLYYGGCAEIQIAVLARRDLLERVPLEAEFGADGPVEGARRAWMKARPVDPRKSLSTMVTALLPGALVERLGGSKERASELPRHVYVSAVGPFARFPWPALIEEALRRAGVPEASLPTVSLVSSQRVLGQLRLWNVATAPGAILALGDPEYGTGAAGRTQSAFLGRDLRALPHSAEEVRKLVDASRDDVALLGAGADEAGLRSNLFGPAAYPFEVLHLACHGVLYRPSGWSSGLVLHPSGADDGILTVEEVGDWRFTTGPRLVVLSACESGVGEPVPGEGEEGLVRALLLAGARHVVASLWSVPDKATADLMVAFHRARREERLSTPAALRRAQEQIRGAGADVAPYQWAGWSVWGPRD